MNKKAFTLVEMIATLVILGIIMLVAVPAYDLIIEKSKDNKCDADKRAILDAAESFVGDCLLGNECLTGDPLIDYHNNANLTVHDLITKEFINDDFSKYDAIKIKITATPIDGITNYSYEIDTSDIGTFKNLCKQ